MNDITYEQYMELKKKFDEAENDTTPYIALVDDEVNVVGDPQKTERKKGTYKIQFGYPNNPAWRKRLDESEIFNTTDNYIGVERTYTDVWASPRVQTAVMATFAELYKFFYVITEDGKIRDMNVDEIVMALKSLNQDMVDAMCHAVATILKIEPLEEDFMLTTSTAVAVIQIIDDFPEIINGMDFFTEQSSEKA